MVPALGSPFVDGYPSDPSQPDYAIQNILDGELRNCEALAGTHANNGMLYPAYFATTSAEHAAWQEPALRRFTWNSGREPWQGYMRGLLRMLVSWGHPPESDSTLLLLAQLGPRLEANGGGDCNAGEAIAAHLKTRRDPLSAELIDALTVLVQHLIAVHSHGNSTFNLAWRLWRAPENPDDGGPCFSARVRAELRGMGKAEATGWNVLFDLRPSDPAHEATQQPYTRQLRAAVARIGREPFAAHWRTWIDSIAADQPAELSAVGRDLLLIFVHACGADARLDLDDALYRLCGVRWAARGNRLLTKEWLGALLITLATRPAGRAFACAELLTQNPDTKAYRKVHQLYQHLLAEVAGEAVSPDHAEGVDGYDLMCEPELYRPQAILDRCLRDALSDDTPGANMSVWHDDPMVPLLVGRQAAGDRAAFVRAVAARLRWLKRTSKPAEVIGRHETPLGTYEVRGPDPYLHWRVEIESIQRQLLAARPALDGVDLVELIETDTAAGMGASTRELLGQVKEHVRRNGYTLRLVEAIERWHAGCYGSASALGLRRQMGWLLWVEDVAPIREGDCWSHRIRKELRAMPPEERKKWRAIVEHATFVLGRKPPRGWEKAAKTALAAVPAVEFRERIRRWFAPFREGERLHLTVSGRDVARNLMWHALVAMDAEVDEAVAWFAEAQWRNKRDRSCAQTLLSAWAFVLIERSDSLAHRALETLQARVTLRGKTLQAYQDLCVRLRRQPLAQPSPPPTPAPGLLPTILKRFADPTRVRMENDRLVVAGVRDTYEIDVKESRIVRRSDGRPIRIEIDFSQPGFAMMRPLLDGMDMNDPFQPNYFRLMVCARMLLHDDINAASIVADGE